MQQGLKPLIWRLTPSFTAKPTWPASRGYQPGRAEDKAFALAEATLHEPALGRWILPLRRVRGGPGCGPGCGPGGWSLVITEHPLPVFPVKRYINNQLKKTVPFAESLPPGVFKSSLNPGKHKGKLLSLL